MIIHTIKRIPWLNSLLGRIYYETRVRIRDRRAYARWKLFRRLKKLSSLIVSEAMTGGEITDNGDFYIRTHDDLYLFYNYNDNRFTLGDGQSMDFRSAHTEVFFEKFIERHSATLKVYIDVGANNGYWYSLKVAKRIPNSRVYAFEPDNKILPHLMKNVEFNHLKNITVIPKALSIAVGTAKLTDGLGASGYLVTNNNITSSTVDVECTTLDSFVKQYGLMGIDFIKVDIEGGEFNFLRGAMESIQRFRPIMLLELAEQLLHRCDSSVDDVVSMLLEMNYKCYRIEGTNDALCVPESKLLFLCKTDHEQLKEIM